jgi:NADPH:quinone reductase-like Zn-dependent oxidoreductase
MARPPEKSQAIQLLEYNSNLLRAIIGLKVTEKEIRKLKEYEVLIRTDAVPCNPSDIAFIRGGYNVQRTLPAVPGFEGTGVVIDTGIRAAKYMNKRVSAFVQADGDGTWAEHFIASAKDCILIKEVMDIDQAACLSINPFTAFALVESAVLRNCKAIVQNAAGGQVAHFIRIFADHKGIEVINIVRKPDQATDLKGKGLKYVLDSTNDTFNKELQVLAHQLNANLAFDAAGGEMTAALLHSLPDRSEVVLYGGLAGGTLNHLDPFDIIFRNRKLSGFNLADWKKLKCQVEFEDISRNIQEMMIEGKMKTKIQGVYKFGEVVDALRTYIKSMSAGKILFKP